MVELATIENILNLYLYGVLDKPELPQDRLRDLSPKSDDVFITTSVNAVSYMNTVGRFAKLGDAQVIRDFFNGDISRQGVTDHEGTTRITLGDLLDTEEEAQLANFTVSQYIAGQTDGDFHERAFIWGSTSFKISEETTLVWDATGNLSVENGAILPFDDDFNFESSNEFVQLINETLEPIIDPYSIARMVKIIFLDEDKQLIRDNAIGSVYTSGNHANYVLENYIFASPAALIAAGAGAVVGYTNGVFNVIADIVQSEAVNYIYENKDIIYGTLESDTLDYDSHIGTLTGSDPYTYGAYIVGGAGNDYIIGGSIADTLHGGDDHDDIDGAGGNDTIYGEEGDDTIYGGDGDDIIDGGEGENYIYGGDGDEHIQALGGEVYGDNGNDVITGSNLYIEGGDGSDTIVLDTGGTIEGGAGNDEISIISYENDEFFVSGGAGDDVINLNGESGDIFINYNNSDGNDIINNNLTSYDDALNISVNQQYSEVDIYLDILTAELIYSDQDRSEWKISSNINLKYGNDILTLNNVYANVYSIGNGNISASNVSGYESINFSVSESLLYFSGYDQNVDYFVI